MRLSVALFLPWIQLYRFHMSASAIARRRAAAAAASPVSSFPGTAVPPSPTPAPANRMMTLQEVITLVDTRLATLEQHQQQQHQQHQQQQPPTEEFELLVANSLSPHLDEFNHRYEILATEIMNLKNIVLKLQSYTLEVNKMLVDERIRVLSDPINAEMIEHTSLIHECHNEPLLFSTYKEMLKEEPDIEVGAAVPVATIDEPSPVATVDEPAPVATVDEPSPVATIEEPPSPVATIDEPEQQQQQPESPTDWASPRSLGGEAEDESSKSSETQKRKRKNVLSIS